MLPVRFRRYPKYKPPRKKDSAGPLVVALVFFLACLVGAVSILSHAYEKGSESSPVRPTITPSEKESTSPGSSVTEAIRLINAERLRAECKSVKADKNLTSYAQTWSDRHLYEEGYLHYSDRRPDEVVAQDESSASAVVSAWSKSSRDNAILTNCDYTKIGVGYVASGNWWTAVFSA